MVKRRVVVTGLGAVTHRKQCPSSMGVYRGSHSGITKITKFDASNYASRIAEVKGFKLQII